MDNMESSAGTLTGTMRNLSIPLGRRRALSYRVCCINPFTSSRPQHLGTWSTVHCRSLGYPLLVCSRESDVSCLHSNLVVFLCLHFSACLLLVYRTQFTLISSSYVQPSCWILLLLPIMYRFFSFSNWSAHQPVWRFASGFPSSSCYGPQEPLTSPAAQSGGRASHSGTRGSESSVSLLANPLQSGWNLLREAPLCQLSSSTVNVAWVLWKCFRILWNDH